jgi:hypothetical protein
MTDDGIRNEIARLEERIEGLRESIARCRKISLGSKIAIAAGFAWLGLTLLILVPLVPSLFFAAVAAVIGGIVLLGSNATTWNEIDAALAKAEAERIMLIDAIDLTTVGPGATRLQ